MLTNEIINMNITTEKNQNIIGLLDVLKMCDSVEQIKRYISHSCRLYEKIACFLRIFPDSLCA